MVETLAAGCHEGEVHYERDEEAGGGTPTIGATPEDATEDADAHVGGHRFCEQKRVEHAIHQKEGVEDAQKRQNEATDAAGPEVVCVGGFAAEEALVKVLGEEGARVDHEGGASAHVGGEDAGEHEAEASWKQQVAAGKAEGVFGVFEAAKAGVGIGGEGGDHQANHGPTDGADALDEVAMKHSIAAGTFVFTGTDSSELVGLGDDSDQAVQGEQEDEPDADAVRGGQ